MNAPWTEFLFALDKDNHFAFGRPSVAELQGKRIVPLLSPSKSDNFFGRRG